MVPMLPADDLNQVLLHTRDCWGKDSGMTVLFTGASGFFGGWMLESFLLAGHRLNLPFRAIVVTRNAGKFKLRFPHLADDPGVELLESDVSALAAPAGPVDYIIHSLIPDAGTPLEEMELFFQSATKRLLEMASWKAVKGFLLCSTGAVYQPLIPRRPFAESDPLVPAEGPPSYPLIRRKVEEQCLEAFREADIPVKIARGFAFVGARLPLNANFAIGNFIRDALAGGPVVVQGDGTSIRSYLYASDMAAWLWTVLLKGAPGRAFNVGSGEAVSIGDLARMIGRMFDVETIVEGNAPSGAAPDFYIPSTRRVEEDLGLLAWTGLSEAIIKTLRWHTRA